MIHYLLFIVISFFNYLIYKKLELFFHSFLFKLGQRIFSPSSTFTNLTLHYLILNIIFQLFNYYMNNKFKVYTN